MSALHPSSLSCQVCDVVEPSSKPGDSTLVLLGALTPLIRKLGPAADPANLKRLPIAAAAVWALYVGAYSCYGGILSRTGVCALHLLRCCVSVAGQDCCKLMN
jgi:hypothetical protein